jgi:uncharacterized membrane protein YbaN (DUF454 family)
MKKAGFFVGGWSLIGLGIAGLALPFVPGIVFILLGLVTLSSQYVWAQRVLAWLCRKFPTAARHVDLRWLA